MPRRSGWVFGENGKMFFRDFSLGNFCRYADFNANVGGHRRNCSILLLSPDKLVDFSRGKFLKCEFDASYGETDWKCIVKLDFEY